MAKFEVPIQMGEVPVVDTIDALHSAAAALAMGNAAYVVADTISSDFGSVTQHNQKLNALVYGLDQTSRGWQAGPPRTRTVDATQDLGMHGNPYRPGYTTDYLHYHRTPRVDGGLTVTFADATYAYMEDQAYVNRRLTALLAEGKTDPRYADPESFRQVALGVGGVVLFRLNEGQGGLPLLHSFQTTGGGSREAEITPVYRFDDYPYGSSISALEAILRRAFRDLR